MNLIEASSSLAWCFCCTFILNSVIELIILEFGVTYEFSLSFFWAIHSLHIMLCVSKHHITLMYCLVCFSKQRNRKNTIILISHFILSLTYKLPICNLSFYPVRYTLLTLSVRWITGFINHFALMFREEVFITVLFSPLAFKAKSYIYWWWEARLTIWRRSNRTYK